ncbi:sensor histidine kinase [Hufsiella ginkgonis]|uniref:histidine kinase n=1 Tax=Hufsiella ginkgonis TaxID=2695274 RepID=A0A7K1XWF3_9SPHI|nr:HAMP domain-containing sensor histidine kinase [Hufsiella ginkgonis]MXV14846.1 ATP-binding protein [Hufsiella ginkgonis]
MFKKVGWRILLQVILLIITITAGAFLFLKGYFLYLFLLIAVILYQVVLIYRLQLKAHNELNQFVESVHYRDFSRYFDEKHASVEVKSLRRGFNDINNTFKVISREKETQYLYLQKILELVDTGIISYEESSGEVIWMNETLKKMLQLPYLKTIHSLNKRNGELYNELNLLKLGESRIASIDIQQNNYKILLSATAFHTDGKKYRLVAFQNVNEALDETEAKAWQKLLSVLTHEIMNSIAPISSLADTLKNRLKTINIPEEYNDGSLEDLELGIDTIRRRSEGLLKFAETYRSLNKITNPNLKKIFARDLFESLHQLMQPTLQSKNIDMEIILKDPQLVLDADTSLIEQVLINLIVNAIDAIKDRNDPRIVLSAGLNSANKVQIKVADNGAGMPEELLDKIFVPFFSTKKSGSGIGLTLCKQIMMLHHGNIRVQSREGEGTAFVLQF